LNFEDLKRVINSPDQKRRSGTGAHGGIIYEFTKRLNDGSLVCIAEIKNAECWIITGYYDQT